jgi:hypothetical protein
MPLTSTGRPPESDNIRKAIGFWMKIASTGGSIRVCVTYTALAHIDPSKIRDLHAAFEIFDKNRERIEAAASQKFDSKGADDGEHEGQQILMVRSNDL